MHVELGYEEELQRATGGKILLARGHQDGRKGRYGSGSVLVVFRLVVPPLQPGEVCPYLVGGE
jgi:hypothetical protein